MEQQQEQVTITWQVVRDADIKSIIDEDKAIDQATEALEVRKNHHILTFASVYRSRQNKAAKKIIEETGWSADKVAKATATGWILDECKMTPGITPQEIYKLVERAFGAIGSLGVHVTKPLGGYLFACDQNDVDPDVAGAMKVIRASLATLRDVSTPEGKVLAGIDDLSDRFAGKKKGVDAVPMTDEIVTKLLSLVTVNRPDLHVSVSTKELVTV